MKRIFCIILSIVICLSLFGCGKSDTSDKPNADNNSAINTTPTYAPEEVPSESEPKYNNANLSVQKFEDNFAYDSATNRSMIDKINGNILDVYYDTASFYVLTDAGVYLCSWVFDSSAVDIDPDDNTHIHFFGYLNAVFSDDNGQITIYQKNDDDTYSSYKDENMVVGENDLLIIRRDAAVVDEDVFIIKNISKDGITATVAETVWPDGITATIETTAINKRFAFSDELPADIKKIYFADNNDAEGVLLLENGDLYPLYLPHDSAHDEAEVTLGEKIDTGVDRVLQLYNATAVKYIKNNDDSYVHYYTTEYDYSTEQLVCKRAQIRMTDGHSTKDITDGIVSEYLVQLNGNQWYSVSNHSVSSDYEMGITLSAFEFKYKDSIEFGFAPLVQDGKVVDLLANNWTEVDEKYIQYINDGELLANNWILMDDGYIYEYVGN